MYEYSRMLLNIYFYYFIAANNKSPAQQRVVSGAASENKDAATTSASEFEAPPRVPSAGEMRHRTPSGGNLIEQTTPKSDHRVRGKVRVRRRLDQRSLIAFRVPSLALVYSIRVRAHCHLIILRYKFMNVLRIDVRPRHWRAATRWTPQRRVLDIYLLCFLHHCLHYKYPVYSYSCLWAHTFKVATYSIFIWTIAGEQLVVRRDAGWQRGEFRLGRRRRVRGDVSAGRAAEAPDGHPAEPQPSRERRRSPGVRCASRGQRGRRSCRSWHARRWLDAARSPVSWATPPAATTAAGNEGQSVARSSGRPHRIARFFAARTPLR